MHIPAKMFCRIVYFLLGGVLMSGPAVSQRHSERFEHRVYADGQGEKLPFRLLQPESAVEGAAYPLVLFLHGAGERGTDNARQLNLGVNRLAEDPLMKKYPCYVVAPQIPEDKMWIEAGWWQETHALTNEPTAQLRMAFEIVDLMRREFKIDPKRIYVIGISMGGFGTWDAIARHPDLFAAAIPICGGGDEHQADKLAQMPIWTFHCDQDGTVNVDRTRHMVEALRRAGGQPRYTEYHCVDHNAWTPAFAEEDLFPWLFSHVKR